VPAEVLPAGWAKRLASDRKRRAENSHLTKHVVAAGKSVRDAGSIPAASTTSTSTFTATYKAVNIFNFNFQTVFRQLHAAPAEARDQGFEERGKVVHAVLPKLRVPIHGPSVSRGLGNCQLLNIVILAAKPFIVLRATAG